MEPKIKTPWLEEGGFPEPRADDPRAELFPRRRPWRAPEGGGRAGLGHRRGRSPRGRVTGLGSHETRLRSGLQPREERNGFKGPQQINPCYPVGTPRQAASRGPASWGWLPGAKRGHLSPPPTPAPFRRPGRGGAIPGTITPA